jgi:transcriptional regulator with XRE-family HTH domain
MDLAARIAAWRKARNLTQAGLAKMVGVTRAAVSQWEGAGEKQTEPSQESLRAVVDALGLTMERFYGRVPTTKKAA